MRHRVTGVIIVALVAVLGITAAGAQFAFGAQGDKPQPTVTLSSPVVELNEATKVAMMGSGFGAKQGLNVLMADATGSVSNISDALDPKPKIDAGIETDANGQFAVLITLKEFARVGAEGVYAITITDMDYNVLATVPIGLGDPNGRSRIGIYPTGKPDYAKNPKDPRPLPWLAPFFKYPERPKS